MSQDYVGKTCLQANSIIPFPLRLLNPLESIILVLINTKVARAGMGLKGLRSGSTSTKAANVGAGLVRGDLLIGAGFQVLADPQAAGVTGSSAGGKDVICADSLS